MVAFTQGLLAPAACGGACVAGWWTIRFAFPKLSQPERNARVQAWSKRMLEIMGIR
jgi:1-acyl-sn-glycerol-3-phosphate acyltransferase